MQIETYEIEEVKGELGNMAADSEAIDIINELGLEGQQKLCNPETATRFAYPRLSASQAAVFHVLFPERSSVERYSQGIIPLRVLQVIAFCKQFPQTQSLKIWHAASVKEDPVLIGSPSEYSSEEYLLARWGDSLLPFEKLLEKAIPATVAQMRSDAAKAISKLKIWSDSMEDIARVYLATGNRPTWNVYE